MTSTDTRIEATQKMISELDATVTKATEIPRKQHLELVALTANMAAATELCKLTVDRWNAVSRGTQATIPVKNRTTEELKAGNDNLNVKAASVIRRKHFGKALLELGTPWPQRTLIYMNQSSCECAFVHGLVQDWQAAVLL